MTPEEELLLEQVLSAHRQRGPDGAVRSSPAWHDLPEVARREAYEVTVLQRDLEAALDPDGHSTTVATVLSRIRKA